MDYRKAAKINQNKNMKIKHMAFAVKNVEQSLKNYKNFLSKTFKMDKPSLFKSLNLFLCFLIGVKP